MHVYGYISMELQPVGGVLNSVKKIDAPSHQSFGRIVRDQFQAQKHSGLF